MNDMYKRPCVRVHAIFFYACIVPACAVDYGAARVRVRVLRVRTPVSLSHLYRVFRCFSCVILSLCAFLDTTTARTSAAS